MIAKYWSPSRHASRSSDAISALQGPHQLAQTLMSSGLPRNALKSCDGPFRPCIFAARRIPPTGTSPGVSAMAAGVATARHNSNAYHRAGGRKCASSAGIRMRHNTSGRSKSAARSAIMIVGAFVLPPISRGMTDASTTRKPSTPRTRSSQSTTERESLPIRQVPTGW